MPRLDRDIDRLQLARRVSRALDDVAASLTEAANAQSFIAALRKNGDVWQEIQAYSSVMGWNLPKSTMDFALSASARQGVNDRTVEAIIAINARIARQIGQATAPAA